MEATFNFKMLTPNHTAFDGEVISIMAPGGAATAWFDPMSKVHVFTPPAE